MKNVRRDCRFLIVYFTDLNCSGTPILEVSSGLGEQVYTLLPRVAVAKPGSSVYLADTAGPTQTLFYTSTLTASFDNDLGGVCVNIGSTAPVNGRPATLLIDLDAEFTPPFRAQHTR